MFREVQFIFRMAVNGIGKLCFVAVGDVEAIALRQRGYLPHYIVLVFHKHWLKEYHATNIGILFNPMAVLFVTFYGNVCHQ